LRLLPLTDSCGSSGSMSQNDDPDSRDWIPPVDMQSIFTSLKYARMAMSIDGDGAAFAIECLTDAVEALAIHIAGDRGRRG